VRQQRIDNLPNKKQAPSVIVIAIASDSDSDE
jgi:hypothetical protein